jgi:hypothetical protein
MGLINLYRIHALYQHLRRGLIDDRRLLQDSRYWLDLFRAAWKVQEVREMITWLQGKKTYAVAVLAAALTLLHSLGYIDDQTYQTLVALLASGGAATVAAKINRLKKNGL